MLWGFFGLVVFLGLWVVFYLFFVVVVGLGFVCLFFGLFCFLGF